MQPIAQSEAERLVVHAVDAAAGRVPVLLCGSRALGTAGAGSDYDVVVVVPWLAIPRRLRRLRLAAHRLTTALGAEVSINPLPASRIARPESLYAWKLRRESRVLAAPAGFALADAGPLRLEPVYEFSYVASAALYLLGGLSDPSPSSADPVALGRGVRKGLLHLAQLRLLRSGLYRESLSDAVEALGDARMSDLAAAPGEAAFLGVRDAVLEELDVLVQGMRRVQVVRTNLRYVVLAALRGRVRLRSALSAARVDCALASAAADLLRSVPRAAATPVDSDDWRTRRAAVLREWPDAHPLAAQ